MSVEQFKLMGPEKYNYTNMGQSLNVQGIDDIAEFQDVRVSNSNRTSTKKAGVSDLF